MTLGENIRSQRRAMGLSQEALAEKLEVSRQSVYKWESDQAQPELDKLVKLSEMFGVSLDELVKGAEPARETVIIREVPEKRSNRPGMIFLFFAAVIAVGLTLLGNAAAGLILALPFLICALVCFNVKNHVRLWCAWVWYLAFYVFLRFGTGLSPATVIRTFVWTAEMNYMRLVIAWAMFVVTVIMMVATVRTYRPQKAEPTTKAIALLCVAWVVTAVVMFFPIHGIILRYVKHTVEFYNNYGVLITLLCTLQELAVIALAIVNIRKTWSLIKK